MLVMPVWVVAEPAVKADEHRITATYLYNLSKFVQWPAPHVNEKNQEIFDICILGKKNSVMAAINPERKATSDVQVVVSYINDVPFLDECHILYIDQSEVGRLGDVLQSVANQPVLTVSDIDGFVDNGGCIELVTRNDQTGFNINPRAAHHSQLKFSAQLLELHKAVADK